TRATRDGLVRPTAVPPLGHRTALPRVRRVGPPGSHRPGRRVGATRLSDRASAREVHGRIGRLSVPFAPVVAHADNERVAHARAPRGAVREHVIAVRQGLDVAAYAREPAQESGGVVRECGAGATDTAEEGLVDLAPER